MFKYWFGIKTTFLVTSEKKTHLKARFRQNQLKVLSFLGKWLFKACWSSEWVPKNYYNILYVQIFISDQNNFAGVTSVRKKLSKGLI